MYSDRERDRNAVSQTDSWTDRRTDRQTDRQTDRETDRLVKICVGSGRSSRYVFLYIEDIGVMKNIYAVTMKM